MARIKIQTGLYHVCPKCRKAIPHVIEIEFEGIDLGELLKNVNWLELLSGLLKRGKKEE